MKKFLFKIIPAILMFIIVIAINPTAVNASDELSANGLVKVGTYDKNKRGVSLYSGEDFNKALKSLVKSTDNGTFSEETHIEKIIFLLINEEKPNLLNILGDSIGKDAYAVLNNSVVYIYTNADTIYLPSDFSYAFSYFTALKEIHFGNKIDSRNVKYINDLYNGCTNLIYPDFGIFDGSDIYYMSFAFQGCKSIKSLNLSCLKDSHLASFQNVFCNMESITSLDLSCLDTSKVTTMHALFSGCKNLKSINLTGFDTSNAKTIAWMFSGCSSLTSIDLSSFDTSNCEDMYLLFNNCSSLKSVDISHFDTSNVINGFSMFQGCSSLTSVSLQGIDTSNWYSIYGMFKNCTNLESVDLYGIDTSGSRSFSEFFSGCKSLKSVDLSGFKTANSEYFNEMFKDCSSLKELKLNNFEISQNASVYGMFDGCSNLEYLDISNMNLNPSLHNNFLLLNNCSNLSVVIAPKTVSVENVDFPGIFALDNDANNIPDNSERYRKLPTAKRSHRYILIKKISSDTDDSNNENNTEENNNEKEQSSETGNVNSTPSADQSLPASITVDDITYSIDISGNATITKIGSKKKVDLNSVIVNGNTVSVIAIADNACKGNKSIQCVSIGNNIKTIGKNAFYGCKKLKKVTISANSSLKIGKGSFRKINKKCTIRIKGLKGKSKKKVISALKKQSSASVK